MMEFEFHLPHRKRFRLYRFRKRCLVYDLTKVSKEDAVELSKKLSDWLQNASRRYDINTRELNFFWQLFYSKFMSIITNYPSITCKSYKMKIEKKPETMDPEKEALYKFERGIKSDDDACENEPENDIQFLELDNEFHLLNHNSIANYANKFWTSVMNPRIKIQPGNNPKTYRKFTLTKEMVLETLKNLKASSLRRPSGMLFMTAEMLKITADATVEILFLFYNRSLQEAKLPLDWLHTLITPVFVDGDRKLIENYRPLGRTCAPSRILEKIIANYLQEVMTNQWNPHQHGSRKGHSTESQLVCVHEELLLSAFESGRVDCIRISFSRAADKVVHSILVEKLRKLRVDPVVINWVRAFLTKRLQSVRVGNAISYPRKVTSGIPQGSPLTTVLLGIYLNDLATELDCENLYQFSDDTLISHVIRRKNDCKLLQEKLHALESWMEENKMEVYTEKCQVLSFAIKGKVPSYDLNFNYTLLGEKLEKSENMKYLGVYLSDDFTWHKHIKDYVIQDRGKSALAAMEHFKKSPHNEQKKKFYVTHLRARLDYCGAVWSPDLCVSNWDEISAIEKLQNKLIDAERNQLTSLAERRLKKLLLLVFKIINREEPYAKISKSLDIFDEDFNLDVFDVYFSTEESIVGRATKELHRLDQYLYEHLSEGPSLQLLLSQSKTKQGALLEKYCAFRYDELINDDGDFHHDVISEGALFVVSKCFYPKYSSYEIRERIETLDY